MTQESLSLRVSLAVLGIAIVIGVYLFTSLRKRRENRRNFERNFSRIDLSDVILKEESKDDYSDTEDSFLKNEDSHSANRIKHTDKEELPQIRNDIQGIKPPVQRTGQEKKDQLDLFSSETQNLELEKKKDIPLRELETDTVANETGLINLFVESGEEASFSGAEIVRHLNSAGMRHGEMSIFHMYEDSTDKSETVLFSVANMYEPGTFDLKSMDSFETRGVVFFMQLYLHRDNEAIFTKLLETARMFSRVTNATLNVEPGMPLDEYHILKFRRSVAADKDENP